MDNCCALKDADENDFSECPCSFYARETQPIRALMEAQVVETLLRMRSPHDHWDVLALGCDGLKPEYTIWSQILSHPGFRGNYVTFHLVDILFKASLLKFSKRQDRIDLFERKLTLLGLQNPEHRITVQVRVYESIESLMATQSETKFHTVTAFDCPVTSNEMKVVPLADDGCMFVMEQYTSSAPNPRLYVQTIDHGYDVRIINKDHVPRLVPVIPLGLVYKSERLDYYAPMPQFDKAVSLIFNDKGTMWPHLKVLCPMSAEVFAKRRATHREEFQRRGSFFLDIVERKTQRVLGTTGFRAFGVNEDASNKDAKMFDTTATQAEWGIVICKERQRNGFCREAFQSCLAYVRRSPLFNNIRHIEATTLGSNEPMKRYLISEQFHPPINVAYKDDDWIPFTLTL